MPKELRISALGLPAMSLLMVLVTVGCLLVALPAMATFPGGPGLIAFVSDRSGDYEIYALNLSDGSLMNLTNSPGHDLLPAWSADGSKIAFASTRSGSPEIYTMGNDGSNVTRITNNFFSDTSPTWSPDGSRLAYSSFRGGNFDIFVANSDGTNETQLTLTGASDTSPSWSPDGTKIAYVSNINGSPEIYVVGMDGSGTNQLSFVGGAGAPDWTPNGSALVFDYAGDVYAIGADGSGLTNLTNSFSNELLASWSPDGTKIVYGSDAAGSWDVYVMNADGSNVVSLTGDSPYTDIHQDWQPVVPTALADGSVELVLGGPPASKSGSKRFMVRVTNLGPDPMSGSSVAVSITVNGGAAPGTITRLRPADAPTINSGESTQFQFEWSYPKGSFQKGDVVEFSVALTADPHDPNSSNNSASETSSAN